MFTTATVLGPILLFSQITLAPPPDLPAAPDKIGLFKDGTIWVLGNDLFHYDRAGDLIVRTSPPVLGALPTSVYWDGDFYFLCQHDPNSSEIRTWTSVLAGGQELYRTTDFFSRYFRPVGKTVWGFPYLSLDQFWTSTPPFLGTELILGFDGNILEHATGLQLYPATLAHLETNLNFKLLWFAQKGSLLAIVSQIFPEVILFQGNLEKGKVSLDLPRFSLYRAALPNPPKAMDHSKYLANWFYSWSRILGFGTHGQGYYIAYEGNNCRDGECAKPDLMIQPLDMDFNPIGAPIERGPETFFVGSFDNAFYIFHPNIEETEKGPAPHPTIEVLPVD